MPDAKYINLTIGGRTFDVPQNENIPVSIDFQIEDEDNFEQKKSATALNIVVPATLENSEAMNTFFNPLSEDYSPDNFLKDVQPFSLVANGNELIVGKAILKQARMTDKPIDFQVDLYGNNGDWAIQNSELTLHDVVSDQTHIFDLSTATVPGVIDTSWDYDGTVEGEEFVYAPARYINSFPSTDTDMPLEQLKPSLFLYWLLYRGFQKAGYKIQSSFMDSEYFRRLVMPWTWGNFLFIDSTELDVMKFKSKLSSLGFAEFSYSTAGAYSSFMNASMPLPFIIDNEASAGGFDNSGNYTWDGTNAMEFTYLPDQYAQFGELQFILRFYADTHYDLSANSSLVIEVQWSVNGGGFVYQTMLNVTSPALSAIPSTPLTIDTSFISPALVGGDVVRCRVLISGSLAALAHNVNVSMSGPGGWGETFIELVGFKVPIGGTVDLKKYNAFKNYKWVDVLRGTIDMFNLQIQTDSIKKVVYIEPTHQYSLDSNPIPSNGGYYNGNLKDWTDKQDRSKITTVENYCDYEQIFKIFLKPDENDGMYKLISDRINSNITQSIYQFPSRFKKGTKEMENRFFGPVMHYYHDAWKDISDVAPQLICIIPENISNSSSPSANNVFLPKLAYYKGLMDVNDFGGWRLEAVDTYRLPFMFAVNYFTGGEDDPILTYCDQNIDGVKGMGLFKRFFWQRFAIMRHGKKVTSSMYLNNSDALDYLQREFKMIGDGKYQCIRINGYKPLMSESTECTFWLWYPVSQVDYDNTFPSEDSVMNYIPLVNTIDCKYTKLICLSSDIPH